MDIKAKYGSCILPQGTVIFTAREDSTIENHCFFALSYSVANVFKNGREIFAYKVKHDIEILFLIKDYNNCGKFISAIDDVYKHHYPREKNIDDLTIKQNNAKLKKLISILKKQNYNGFLNSVENKPQLEILLLGDKFFFNNLLVKLDLNAQETKEIFKNYYALVDLIIHPSSDFLKAVSINSSYNSFNYQKELVSITRPDGNIDYYCYEDITNKKVMYELF